MGYFPTKTCQIKRNTGEGRYENGAWVPPGETLIATAEADIQPRTGRERATEIQTEYESDYKAFIDNKDITFVDGYSEIKKGDTLIDPSETKYTIVYPGRWDDHYESDLKEQ